LTGCQGGVADGAAVYRFTGKRCVREWWLDVDGGDDEVGGVVVVAGVYEDAAYAVGNRTLCRSHSSKWGADWPTLLKAGSSRSTRNRSHESRESHTLTTRHPPGIGPASRAIAPAGGFSISPAVFDTAKSCSAVPPGIVPIIANAMSCFSPRWNAGRIPSRAPAVNGDERPGGRSQLRLDVDGGDDEVGGVVVVAGVDEDLAAGDHVGGGDGA
jgi:hypothetical protein